MKRRLRLHFQCSQGKFHFIHTFSNNNICASEIKELERLSFVDSIAKTPRNAIPCTIREIPVLRQAQVWASSNLAAIEYLSKPQVKGFVLRVEDIQLKRNRMIANLLNHFGGYCTKGGDTSKPYVFLRKGTKLFISPYTGKILKATTDEFGRRERKEFNSLIMLWLMTTPGKRSLLWQQDPRAHQTLIKQVLATVGVPLLGKLGYLKKR